jgi:carbamate kinase
MRKRILVALGGNAIKQADEKGTPEEQFRNCAITCRHLAEIARRLKKQDRLVITHGNGPQAGNLLVQQEEAKLIVPPQTLDIIVAMTQGQIGYMLQQTLTNHLRNVGIETPVCVIINQVVVDKNDPEFHGQTPSKPVGDFFTKKEALKIATDHPDYVMKRVKPIGRKAWRRCVPSPHPIENVEGEVIRRLLEAGFIVIASGGGGIPVILDEHGNYKGVDAVIDKDLAGEKLAEIANTNIFLVLTDVDKVKLNFGKVGEKEIDKMTLEEAKRYFEEGHFLSGSMGPKVKACIRFLEWGGDMAIITSLDKAIQALDGKAGTLICRGRARRALVKGSPRS